MNKIILPLLFLWLGAAACAKDLIEAKPGMEVYTDLYNRAMSAHLKSRFKKACGLYVKAAEEAARRTGAKWAYGRAITMLAVAYHTRGNYLQAEKYYLESIDYCRKNKLPELTTALSGLGRLYLDEELPKKAAPLLEEAGERESQAADDPADKYALADSLSSLGRLQEQLGGKEKAKAYYLAAVKLFKDAPTASAFKVPDAEHIDSYPIILYRAGLIYSKSGKPGEAAACYVRAMKAFENWTGLDDRPALKARVLQYRGLTMGALGRDSEAEADRKKSVWLYKRVRKKRLVHVEDWEGVPEPVARPRRRRRRSR